jgi:hypothetical protein
LVIPLFPAEGNAHLIPCALIARKNMAPLFHATILARGVGHWLSIRTSTECGFIFLSTKHLDSVFGNQEIFEAANIDWGRNFECSTGMGFDAAS